MVDRQAEKNLAGILSILQEHPGGLSISDIATLLPMNRNSVSKYLAILQRQGSVDMRLVGAAKIYCPTRRLPVAAVRRFCSPNLIVVDHNLEVLEVSVTLAALLGTTPEAIISRPILTLFPGTSSDDVASLLRRALWGEEGTFGWRPGSRRDATSLRFSLIPTVLETGRPAVSLVLEKVPEEADQGEERLLEALRQEALREERAEGIIRVLPDGHIRWADDVYCRVAGKSREDLVGRQFRPPLLEGERTAWKEFVRGLTPKNPAATIDCRVVMPDGGVLWYRWRGRTLCGPDGKILEYQYLCLPMHESRVIEETLRRQLRALEQETDDRAAALRESEERFRVVFEESPAGTAFCGMDGAVVRANRAFLAIFGVRDREEIEGRNIFTDPHMPPDMLRTLQGGEPLRFIIPYPRKGYRNRTPGATDGPETICLEGAASPVFSGENGTPSGFVLQLRDVTGRKKAGAAAKETESRYRNLFEALAEGVIYLGDDGRIIEANPAAERILGYQLSDMQGRTGSELRWRFIGEDGSGYPGDRLPHVTTLATGIPERKTLGIFNPREGGYRWLDLLAVPRFRTGEENPFQVIVIFCDITRQREGEAARAESEKRYRILTESLPDVVFLLDPEGHVLYVNALGARMLHRPPEDVLGKSLPELFPAGQGAQYRRNVASVAATGTIKNNVSWLPLPDGEVWYDTRLIPVRADDGMCRYVMGVARDITASKRAEETLRSHAERFRRIFEDSPTGITVCDPRGVLLHINRACLELFGIARLDDVRGINLLQVCRALDTCEMQAPGDTATPFSCRFDFDRVRSLDLLPTTRTGTIHVGGVVSPLRSPDDGTPDGYLIQVHDVTGRVLAEGALLESHDRLAGIVRHLPDAMFAIDRRGIVTAWNLAMEELTGITAGEILGKGNYEYALPFYGKRTPMLVDKVLNPDSALRNRYRFITYAEGNEITAETVIPPSGGDSPRIWWVKAGPLYDGRGDVVGAIESIRDITGERRAERLLKWERIFTDETVETP
ncbi:PAS domain S-box protein [Methanoculleus sp. 10]|uniref:PAS domain S-box protein n=1 Tax=Methanoculleus sp. 10 TaxID=430615 RepID=UPI0026007874|nr:PAS domain S-box protein [Methanoculleus sp. 10]